MSRRDPAELGRRLDEILAAAERLIRPVPEVEIGELRDTAYRIFRLALAFVDGMDRGRLAGDARHQHAPEDLRDGASVARYGALVRGRVGGWFEGAGPRGRARGGGGPPRPPPAGGRREPVTDEAAGRLRLLEAALDRPGRVS